MPRIPFKKKKKKDLPNPPSFSDDDNSAFSEVIREFKSKTPTKTSEQQGQPIPKTRTSTFEGPPIYEGPPRNTRTKEFVGPPNLPPPPPLAGNIQSKLSPSPEDSIKAPTPVFGNEMITDEIQAELKTRKFGSTMEKTPEKKFVPPSNEEITKRHFRDTKKDNIDAGKKNLELEFYDNAATNFACAILCDLIGEGVQSARKTLSELITGVPSAVMDNDVFDGARLLIEAIRTKNFNFLTRAEQILKQDHEHLYPEDIAIINKALKTAKTYFGYD